jgi:hypothetical protein
MDYEYVALGWFGDHPENKHEYLKNNIFELVAQGWEEYIRAPWKGQVDGGACIMRRPKDEPRKWTKADIKAMYDAWRDAKRESVGCTTIAHVGSDPFCQCDDCRAYLKEETNG